MSEVVVREDRGTGKNRDSTKWRGNTTVMGLWRNKIKVGEGAGIEAHVVRLLRNSR